MTSSSSLSTLLQFLPESVRLSGILDFSDCSNRIVIPPATSIPDSDWVKLLTTHSAYVHTVILNNHPEVNDLSFSRIRYYLPLVKIIKMHNISPEKCQISAKQFVQMYAKNIGIECDLTLQIHINSKVTQYLEENGQQVNTTEQCIAALNVETVRRQEKAKIYQERREVEHAQEQLALSSLISEWESSHGFDKESVWVIDGPTLTSQGLINTGMAKEILVLYILTTKLQLWNVVAKGPGDAGYMFSCPKILDDQIGKHPAVLACGHSGASFGFAMRVLEAIANAGSYSAWATTTSSDKKSKKVL